MKKHKTDAVYFKADDDAVYVDTFEVDLSKVESFVAIYPSPDNVVPVSEASDVVLDGCFIGACTTAEEELIIGALVLSAGLKRGMIPVKHGRRLVVPGSKPIRHRLETLGLINIYKRAGFKIGVPGCSMCVGQGVDQAAPGEKWMSSQNRNFQNRMGPGNLPISSECQMLTSTLGSLAYLGSAATVAASSFSMTISDPRPFLEIIDLEFLEKCLGYQPFEDPGPEMGPKLSYDEPYGVESQDAKEVLDTSCRRLSTAGTQAAKSTQDANNMKGKILALGDFIDTDAIIPSKFLAGSTTNEDLGSHCMEFFMPEFRRMVKDGLNIIVAGDSFGVGSSRDVAVNALLGAGVQCVIAKSFAFIYARNQPNIGLLGIVIEDDDFYAVAQHGTEINIDLDNSEVRCGGKAFHFQLSEMEKQLIAAGGLTEAFKKFGTEVFDALCRRKAVAQSQVIADIENLKQFENGSPGRLTPRS